MDIPVENRRNRRGAFMAGGAIAVLALVTLAVSRLEPAMPSVDRSSIWTDSVRMGDMVREVGGPGTLVSEQARSGRVRQSKRATCCSF